ncbi:MAG: hypothetical protein MMC33_002157 [Icmadophila ericetorum]|nr:hypothetical protein [Icmadophila ericetorum]
MVIKFFLPKTWLIPATISLQTAEIKSNIGRSEPAAGISGLLKAPLSIENDIIPSNPTFVNPSPKIDFIGNKVKAFRTAIPWPENSPRRASINSFGYGGSNAHAITEQAKAPHRVHHVSSYVSAEDEVTLEHEEAARSSSLVLSANDAASLRASIQALGQPLRPRLHPLRAKNTTRNADFDEKSEAWVVAKKNPQTLSFGFVFTGQGAQWSQMGKDLLNFFP